MQQNEIIKNTAHIALDIINKSTETLTLKEHGQDLFLKMIDLYFLLFMMRHCSIHNGQLKFNVNTKI